ncbi:hypothetical protein CR513_30394, partial [Mucuna pruriens]
MSQQQNLPAPSQSLLQRTGSEADVKPFSLREYVVACRQRSILGNWPFYEKHLQLCLKHGIKEVLPPMRCQKQLKGCSNLMHSQNDNTKEADSCKAEVPHVIDEHSQIKNECDYKVTNHLSSHEEGNQHNCGTISANLSQPADTCTLPTSTHVHKTVRDKRRRRKGRCKKRFMVDILAVARHSTLEEIHRMNKFYYAETVIEGCHQTVPCENISKYDDSFRKDGSEDQGVANDDMAVKGPLLLKFKLNGCNLQFGREP